MYNAERFLDWISNDKHNLIHKVDVGYFKYVDEEPADWNFSDEKDKYLGFLNYLNYIWLFKHYFCGILYDKYEDEEYDVPSEDATMAAFNLHLKSSEEHGSLPFYAVFDRNHNSRYKSDWFLRSIILQNGHSEFEEKLHLSKDHTPGPETLIETSLPSEVKFTSFNTDHFYERLSRLPEYIRSRIKNKTDLTSFILKSIFGEYEKGKDGVYRYNQNDASQNTVKDFDPGYLIEKWYAEVPKGNTPGRLLNPNTNSFLYPIYVDNEVDPGAALVFERLPQIDQISSFEGKTIYSLRYAYRNALLLWGVSGLEETWLTKDSVEKSIKNGSL